MPHVVLDTSISLPATLSPRGLTRKLLVLLAYGTLIHRAEQRSAGVAALHHEAEQSGAVAGVDCSDADADADALGRRIAKLRDMLPADAPSDWLAVGSAPIFDEYERKVRQIGTRLHPAIRESDVGPLRRQMEAICAIGPQPFDLARTPTLTRDRKDDPIVYTALLADADYLVSDDRDIVPDGSEHHYEHDGHNVLAVTFNRLMASHFEPADLNWGEIDGRWLAHAYPLSSAGSD